MMTGGGTRRSGRSTCRSLYSWPPHGESGDISTLTEGSSRILKEWYEYEYNENISI